MSLLVATNINEVGISFFDFYSLGHIAMGIGLFLFFSTLIYYFLKKVNLKTSLCYSLILSIIGGIVWEIIENILFFKWGIKFEGRKDSIYNLATDLFFVGIGAYLMLLLRTKFKTNKEVIRYYIFGILTFLFFILAYFIFKYLTLRWLLTSNVKNNFIYR